LAIECGETLKQALTVKGAARQWNALKDIDNGMDLRPGYTTASHRLYTVVVNKEVVGWVHSITQLTYRKTLVHLG